MNSQLEETHHVPPEDAWVFPTSFAQRRLWFIDQVEPGNTLYNIPFAFRVRGRLDPAILRASFLAVVERHEILRTTFAAVEGEPMQIVSPVSHFDLSVAGLQELAPAAQEADILRLVREASDLAFDLKTGPLFRVTLIDLSPCEQVLVIGMHHIITDSWSQDLFLAEVTQAYTALVQGLSPTLPELPIQYADFAAWQRESMKAEIVEKESRFWRNRLAGLTPLDIPHLGEGSGGLMEGATCNFEIPEPLAAAIRAMAKKEGITLFMALLAGWKAFLSRLTGQTDIAIGSPITNRTRTETEDLMGFFLNTLVLRTSLAEDPTVRETLHRVRDTTLEAFAHQDLPFEMMIEDLQPDRLPGKNPLLRAMFVLMIGEEKSWRTPDALIEPMPVDESKTKFDLMLHLRDTGRTIAGALIYDKSLFTPAMARRVAGHYETLLSGMTGHPDARITSLPLISPADRERILTDWNDTSAPFPADRPIHALFGEQVSRNPDAIAVEDRGTEITYRELDRRSDVIAGALIREGVSPGDTVAINLPRSAGLVAGILGILKAGAAYVPLDPSYPAGRLDVMLRESGAKILIGEGELPSTLPESVTWLPISAASGDPRSSQLSSFNHHPSAFAPHPAGVAYVMFTSGSTGIPKGVLVLHRGISRLVINTNYVKFTAADVVGFASNTSFDASTFEIWGALLNGSRLVIVPKETLLSPPELASFLRDRKISILFLTTPLFHHLAREIPGAFGLLRYLVAGGDALQPEAARAVLRKAKPAHLVNGYGPTEVTTFAICHDVTHVPSDAISIPIGRPISNTRAYILDGTRQPVPPGIAGELYLGGPGVAAGYLNDPAATAASFIADPFSTDPASRLYKTGDLARWTGEGLIEFMGRVDNQVKIRGFRIEPGEIEATLLRHPRVREAIVVPRADSSGQKQLAAYVVQRPGLPLTSAELREHILASLPDYMVPGAFAFPAKLPLNANGKVDLTALAAQPLIETRHSHEQPGTWMEATLVDIWEMILDQRPIGVTDDFFDLGGHSLLAIRMLSEVEKKTGIRIPPRLLFEDATVRHLARVARRPDVTSPIVQVQSGSLSPFFFLHGDFVEGGLYCVKMARQIGQDRPFYAIDPHGVYDEPPHTIEEMAAARIELVRQVRPHGPYVLGGFCNGGLVAFEMARQLEAAGETVSSLILLSVDGSNAEFSWLDRLIRLVPGQGDRKFFSFLQWRQRILFARAAWERQLDALAKPVPASEQPRRFARKAARIFRKAIGLMQPRPALAGHGEETMNPESAGSSIAHIYSRACTAYVPRPYGGSAHLLWPGEMPLRDPSAGWSPVIPKINILQVPGGHFSSLQSENLLVVSEKIRQCLIEDNA